MEIDEHKNGESSPIDEILYKKSDREFTGNGYNVDGPSSRNPDY